MKVARTVWSRGKGGDYFKALPIAIKYGGYEEHRRYLNVRLRNRTEELISVYFAMAAGT